MILTALLANTVLSEGYSEVEIQKHFFDFGVGLGLDYGGIVGLKLSYILPFPHISIFGSAGAQLSGFGWNAGTTFHILPENSKYVFRPNVKIMYGINRATIVVGASGYNKLFTGITPGVGFEFMFGRLKTNGFDFDLNIPIGSQEFNDHLDMIKDDPNVGPVTMLPVAVSIGFHHEF